MSNIYNERLEGIITSLGATPDPAPAGNIYVARLDQVIAAVEAGGTVGPAGADGAPGAIAHGSSWPATPAVDDWFARDDLGVVAQWNGTHWAALPESVPMTLWRPTTIAPFVDNATIYVAPFNGMMRGYDIKLLVQTASLNNASNYWTIDVRRDGVTQSSSSTSSDTANTIYLKSISLDVITVSLYLSVVITRTGSPGGIIISPFIRVRRLYVP